MSISWRVSFLVTELSGGEEFSSQQKQITTKNVQDEGSTTLPDDTTVVQEEPVFETVTEEPQVQPKFIRLETSITIHKRTIERL